MEEKSRNMTDEHLSRQLRKSKSGKLGGKLLSLVGGVVVSILTDTTRFFKTTD